MSSQPSRRKDEAEEDDHEAEESSDDRESVRSYGADDAADMGTKRKFASDLVVQRDGSKFAPGQYAASVSSQRSGARRPPPPADKPLTVSEFVAQLHVEDLRQRFSKTRPVVEVTVAKPARIAVADPVTVPADIKGAMSTFALTQRSATQFRTAKRKHEARLKEDTRKLAASLCPHVPRDASGAKSAAGTSVVISTGNGEGATQRYNIARAKEKQGGLAPGLGAALDCIVCACDAVLETHAPHLVGKTVTEDNVREILSILFSEDVGTVLMHEVEKAVQDYQKANTTYTDTVRMVKADDGTHFNKSRSSDAARKTFSPSLLGVHSR